MPSSTQEMAKSNFPEAGRLMRGECKPFAASLATTPTLVTDLVCKDVDGSPFDLREVVLGRVSLMTVCFSAFTEPYAAAYRSAFTAASNVAWINPRSASPLDRQIIRIRPVMNPVKWFLFQRLLSKQKASKPTSACSSRPRLNGVLHWDAMPCNPRWFVFHLDLPSNLGAYAFLIDAAGCIRWRASGPPSADELSQMLNIAGGLNFLPSQSPESSATASIANGKCVG